MINAEQTVMILLVAQAMGGILTYLIFKRETKNTIEKIFGQPIVKGAMSVLGKKSGEVRHDEAVMDQVATTILSSPQAKVLKTIGKQLGFDVDEMVADQGAAETMEQILTAAQMFNIDLSGVLGGLVGGLNSGQEAQTSTDNPYLSK